MSAATKPVPAVGEAMPPLPLVSPTGRRVTLDQVRDNAPAVVYFLRAATCPICLRHARMLTDLAAAGGLGSGVRVVLVAPGGAQEAAQLAARIGSEAVTIWASGNGHAAAGLGTFLSMQHSGTFLVDRGGAVAYRRTAALPLNNFNKQELLDARERV